jgi:transmembrane sensor
MNAGEAKLTSLDEEAAEAFVLRTQGEWTSDDQAALEARLERDHEYAEAYGRARAAWESLDTHAESAELMGYREEALSLARQANARRWLKGGGSSQRSWRIAAAGVGIAVSLGLAWQLSPYGYEPGRYRTDIGEQRVVDLTDHSRIALDAATRLKVRFTPDARIVELEEGQAQFSVAKDPTRAFKVMAGGRTIVAVGTVFTVEDVPNEVHVAMIEGKVAVVPNAPARSSAETGEVQEVSLVAGEELRVAQDGHNTVTPKADIEAATAWRQGKVIIRTESIGEAVMRMNRYSKLKIRIDDPELAGKHVSGVFETGDNPGFVNAIQRYLPVSADYSGSNLVTLRLK